MLSGTTARLKSKILTLESVELKLVACSRRRAALTEDAYKDMMSTRSNISFTLSNSPYPVELLIACLVPPFDDYVVLDTS